VTTPLVNAVVKRVPESSVVFCLGGGGAAVVKKSAGVAVTPRLSASAGVAFTF
jgi:carbamate kinase